MLRGKKLLAMVLIFTITFSYFSIVTEVVAATGFMSLFVGNSNTGNENIEFEAYLSDGNETSQTMVSDVNNENLAIKLELNVKNSGYLKDGKVEIKADDKKELNFAVKEDNKVAENENVQKLENNVIEFNRINNSSDKLEILVPIQYKMEDYINDSKLISNSKIVFSGNYVDDKGRNNDISKEVDLTLAWKDERTIKVEDKIEKKIQFGTDGYILQTSIKVESENQDKNSLPTKETELNIDVPKINNNIPSELTIVANSTAGTNGKDVGNVQFGNENWSYNKEENKITIKVVNQKEEVEIKNEGYLKEESETKKEERYYSKAGTDEYLITYTFKDVEISDDMKTSDSKIEARVTKLSGSNSKSIATAETESKSYDLTGQTGDLVSFAVQDDTKGVSKLYAYLNKEAEFNSKTVIDISYKDIVEKIMVEDTENYYIDKSGSKVQADDIYYKQISINKENFNKILGENGNIKISNVDGNEIAIINKDYAEDNGNYVVNFQNKISKIAIETSAPINTGLIVISNKKLVSNVSVDKSTYANLSSIATDMVQKAKFTYVSDITNIVNRTWSTKLKDTKTSINLVVDKNNLSTVTSNTDVEMRIEFNNNEITSDIYGNSIFEIEMPGHVTDVNVKSASMIYGEGLEITNVEKYSRDGKVILKVTVNGLQKDINSGVLTNGTNIVLNADIEVERYTASIEEYVKARCYNSEMTNYANPVEYTIDSANICDESEARLKYVAPSGLIAVNAISNYNANNTISSIKEGKKVDYIDIYSEAKNAKMDIVVLNNNEYSISDISILGRIPFKGVKDVETGNELGTTVDTKIISGIVSDSQNTGEFTVYYSENGDANKDLEDKSNGWTNSPSSLEKMKSYLIVPNNSDYTMDSKSILKFSYEYQIPENLNHNESIYGTNLIYYKNNVDSTEAVAPDLVGLTTGAGPELDLSIKANKKSIKALEEFDTTITVKNTGEDTARNVTVNIPIPSNASYVSAKASRDTMTVSENGGKVIATTPELAKGASVDITLTLKADNVSEDESNKIFVEASAIAKDLQKELSIKSEEITIVRSEMSLELASTMDLSMVLSKGREIGLVLYPKNLTNNVKYNTVVEVQLPKELEFDVAYRLDEKTGTMESAGYNANAHKVVWRMSEFSNENNYSLVLNTVVGDLDAGITKKEAVISANITADNTETYQSNDLKVSLGKSSLSVAQTTSTPTYVREGDAIDYVFSIKNDGSYTENNVVLTDLIPEGLIVKSMNYEIGNEKFGISPSSDEKANIVLTVPAETQVDVNVNAMAGELNGEEEKTITNSGTLTTNNSESIATNSITHIVQARSSSGLAAKSSSNSSSDDNGSNLTKSATISGVAWIDSNSDGIRDEGEKRLSGVTTMLVDTSSGVIKNTTTTSDKGEYSFSGLQAGTYLVLFKYDTKTYTTTTYKKEGVDTSVNSDAVTTKIDQNSKKENAAVTDKIELNGSNVTNVDVGLIPADKFSLGLDKSITKITVQNEQGTKTETLNKSKLAKYDIAAKYLSGTVVYIEYTMTVTNNGDLAGYASEIVDYIPEGMTFNSNLNSDWYTGTDGNLYTKVLANTELAKGESKEVKLVLTKQMTAENTGIVSNTAEIAEDYNIYGVSDSNSTPANKAQGEDDMSNADAILTVKTGETLIYITVIIICTMVGGAIGYTVYKRMAQRKVKGGV